jgi:uncharacterized protein (TIGR02145 family)
MEWIAVRRILKQVFQSVASENNPVKPAEIMKSFIILAAIVLSAFLSGCKKDPFMTDDKGIFIDDRDNQEYDWIRIGNQVWMAENLAWMPTVSPGSIVSDITPVYYVYAYNGTSETEAKGLTMFLAYGVLYNWEAARMACPEGWVLPGDDDWKTLEEYLGMNQIDAGSNGDRVSGEVGKKLKSTYGWSSIGNGSNSSGFSGLPGGLLIPNGFMNIMKSAVFWTSGTKSDDGLAVSRWLNENTHGVWRDKSNVKAGLSVRCIKE